DEIGIVEACCGRIESLGGEMPIRRPQSPQQTGNFTAVLFQPDAPPLGMEVPLVPVAMLLRCGARPAGARDVLDVVAVDRDQTADTLGPQSGSNAGRTSAPIVAGEYCTLDVEPFHKIA